MAQRSGRQPHFSSRPCSELVGFRQGKHWCFQGQGIFGANLPSSKPHLHSIHAGLAPRSVVHRWRARRVLGLTQISTCMFLHLPEMYPNL